MIKTVINLWTRIQREFNISNADWQIKKNNVYLLCYIYIINKKLSPTMTKIRIAKTLRISQHSFKSKRKIGNIQLEIEQNYGYSFFQRVIEEIEEFMQSFDLTKIAFNFSVDVN